MKTLFVHQNCPGQFKHLAPRLAALPGNEVVFITRPGKPDLPGVRKLEYTPARKPAASTHRYLRLTEEGVLNGQAVAKVATELRGKGFRPDVIVAHLGWGEALYLKSVWPGVPLVGYFEWYYRAFGSDVDFDRAPSLDDVCRINTRNSLHLLNLEMADWGLTPTRWQQSQHPAEYQRKLSVIHDGVDTDLVRPNPQVSGRLKDGLNLKAGDEVITYVARNLEPYRGFPQFMRAAALILKRRPQAQILVVGGDGTSYGKALENGQTYRQQMLAELGDDLDLQRIHFLGRVKYDVFLRVLQLSAAHIYLTYPFVLSWSMLEAMAAGCLVIGSRTAPVEEVIKDGKNGLLVDFFSPEEIADGVDHALYNPQKMAVIRRAARQTVLDHYALESCLSQQVQLITAVARGEKSLSSFGGVNTFAR
ncbi:glycosyltransferase family 4 protein [Propionivibrio sp.]|uniref:glycosyltransferase family 4 protein n=1 Tax=Propionivibrio sp. TaxID=2212460 RepID=UPI003BF09FF1